MQVNVQELLLDLVRIESVSGNEAELAEFVVTWLSSHGVDARRLGDNVLAQVTSGAGPRILFNSHLDTVPACAGWSADPWKVDWANERLVGLGANDAKASVAAMLGMLASINPADFRGTVQLALTACEETSNRGMGEVLGEIERPDMAVTGEPTGLSVVRTQAGLGVLTATWSGKSCHAAHAIRVDHRNALLDAARELAELENAWEFGDAHPLIGRTTVVPTTLHSGERRNVVPDRAVAAFDVRLAPPVTAQEVARALGSRLPTAEVTILSDRLPAVETAADHPLVQAALQATGATAAVGSPTLSDMALLAGVPAIKCGPGETQRSHTANEFVSTTELLGALRAYSELVPLALPR